MRSVEVFEKGDEVYIKAEITDVAIIDGQLQYELKEPIGGNWMKHWFAADELIKKEQIDG